MCENITWFIKIIGIYLLIVVTLVGLSVDRLFLTWAIMECNILLFIPLITFTNILYFPSLLRLKYYFIQSLASVLLLVSIAIATQSNQKNFIELVIIISLRWKMGIPPFHLWLINLIIELDWIVFFIMSTWQKIIPFYLLRELAIPLIDFLILFSIIVRVGIRFEQSGIKKIMIVSSIFTRAWVMSALRVSKIAWPLIILTYARILFPTIIIFNKNIGALNYRFLLSSNSFSEKLMLFLFLISLAGLPPLAGFYLKIIVIFLLLSHRIRIIPCLLILSSVALIFMYSTLLIFCLVSQTIRRNFIISRSNVNFFFLFGLSLVLFFPIILVG